MDILVILLDILLKPPQPFIIFLGQKHKSAIFDRTPSTYTSNLVYMCAGEFRGSKSSNRIQLSRFIQELL